MNHKAAPAPLNHTRAILSNSAKGRAPRRFPLFCFFAILACACALHAAAGASITYRRVFKGSVPEFIEVTVNDDGSGSYDIRQLSDAAGPSPLEVGPAVRDTIFQLAAALQNFEKIDLDSHKKMADTGAKTLRYAKDGVIHEAQFNYTLNRDAEELRAIFEALAQQQGDWDAMEQKLKYDRLGVNDALIRFERDLGKGVLLEPDRLLPVLDRIAADTRVIEVARTRARSLAERIRLTRQTPLN